MSYFLEFSLQSYLSLLRACYSLALSLTFSVGSDIATMRTDSLWAGFIYFLDILTFQSPKHDAVEQTAPLGNARLEEALPGPIFAPPSGDPEDKIVCNYTAMTGWTACSSKDDRGCWLRGPQGEYYGINTDYELKTPIGVTRQVLLPVTVCYGYV